jgi:hypothetical protein
VAEAEARSTVALAAQRRTWLAATVTLTVAPFLAAIALAPDGNATPAHALVWLLFIGSSMHVGATGWFLSVPVVRAHMAAHAVRYVWVPIALVAGWAFVAGALSERQLVWLLLGFFAWQFFHFQKQNLGLAALAARGFGARGLSVTERRALVVAGLGGIGALLGHPDLLQIVGAHRQDWLFAAGGVVFVLGLLVGGVCLARRPTSDRPIEFAGVYMMSLLFFTPVFCFASPYAAVAGLTIAHGLQYLLLVGFLAAEPTPGRRASVGLLILLNVALALGVLLNWSSHLHAGAWLERVMFGVYLGLVSAHFVVDAGLWRLRDEFPRTFLAERLPFLLRVPKKSSG